MELQLQQKLKSIIPDAILQDFINTCDIYNINSTLRISHFLAQVIHESGNFKNTEENLRYSAAGLLKTFSKRFKTLEEAKLYEKQPQKIANKVYSNRKDLGNGDELSGDGWRFRGRGFIQITGRNNYSKLSTDLKIDFITNPDLLLTTKYACLSAGWFWNVNNLNVKADKGNSKSVVEKITLVVNGGKNGLGSRIEIFNKVYNILAQTI